MPDVLDLMVPRTTGLTVYNGYAEVESLRFLDWFRYDTLLAHCLSVFVEGRWADGLGLICKANELAAGLDASADADDSLAAFVVLGELNELRYLDPDLSSAETTGESDSLGLDNYVLVEMVVALASRFSMSEIMGMTPEFAILCWQRIREEIADDRDVVFYASEIGYDKRYTNRKSGKYKLIPRESPYTPLWCKKRRGRLARVQRARQKPHVPGLVFDKGSIIDGRTGKTLLELGEVLVIDGQKSISDGLSVYTEQKEG